MKKVLVVGGAGYIGSVLCESLLSSGYLVSCLDTFFFGEDTVAKCTYSPNFRLLKGDIRTVEPGMLEGFDALVDLAGISNDPSCDLDPNLTIEINTDGAIALARLAKNVGIRRYIYASSCSVYGESGENVSTEESMLRPVSLYAKSKVAVEQELARLSSNGFEVVALRNATVFGLSPRMRFDLIINIMTKFAFCDKKIFVLGGGEQWRPLVHVRDVVSAIRLSLDYDVEGNPLSVFNIGSSEHNYTVMQVAKTVQRIIPEIEIDVVPDDPDKRSYHVSFDKAFKSLGFQARFSPEDGVKEIADALARGKIDLADPRLVTLKYYQELIDRGELRVLGSL